MDVPVWMWVVFGVVVVVAFLVGRMSRSSEGGYVGQAPGARPARPERSPRHGSDAEADAEIRRLLETNQVIEAIKRYREAYGVGLKEAKDAIDAMR